MKRKTLRVKALVLGLLLAFSFSKALAGKPVVVISANISTDTYWDSSHIYQISGLIYVRSNSTLTIQEGTVIQGIKSPIGALIITRGSKINAVGSIGHPIVFTSAKSPAGRQRGDWGGVVILGKAPHNLGGAYVEGIAPNDNTWFGTNGAAGTFYTDGSHNDPHDNSGILKYVRIEFAGFALSPNNEINGLTLGAVGDGTTIDYVQVSYANDDSYEWFGGTVNCKHLIAFRGIDDDFDTDNGFSGKVQFIVGLRDPNVADQSNSAGFESDNNADGTVATPITKAVFSNATLLGGGDTTNSFLFKGAAHIRRNSGMYAINSILQGYPQGLQIDGTATHNRVMSDTLVMNSIVTVKSGAAGNRYVVSNAAAPLNTNVIDLLLNHAGNQFGVGNAFTQLNSPYNLTAPNFNPKAGSPALDAANFQHPVFIADAAGAAFFDQTVTYVGAFGPNALDDWTAGWANFNPTASDAPKAAVTQNCASKGNLPTLAVTATQPVCKTGRITATASKGAAPTGTPYEYIWGRVYGTDTVYEGAATQNGTRADLDSGIYAVKAKLGICYSPAKVVKLVRQLPKFGSAVAKPTSLLVEFNLGKLYLSMPGYATQLRYKKAADADWSIWSGNNNQNTYYFGTTPKDSLWRWYDSTKTFTGNPNYNNHPLLTDATGKANYFNPASLFANLFVNLTPNTQYQFQLRGRCFTSTGAVVYSDTIMTSKLFKTPKLPALLADVENPEAAVIDGANKTDAIVYPNPGKSIINVKTTGFKGTIVIRVLNMNGAVVYNTKQTSDLKEANQTLNLTKLASGNYIVEVSDGVKKISKQITIIK